jgi:hypothetical protein
MSRRRALLIGATLAAALALPAAAHAHESGFYNDGKRPKFSHADGIALYALTADQKMQFELFVSGFENRQKRIDGELKVVPVPYFKFKLHTHYFAGTELQITIRYTSHATSTTRTYLKEWRDLVPPSGNIERTEFFPMGLQLPAGRYMVEAWFHENRQSPELRKKMWAPRTDADRALYDAGKDYDTAFFYMTPPSEYSRNTSMNEILTHGEGGEYRSTQNTDRECKEEIAVIYEQVTRVCKSWAAVERAMERVMAGDDISRDQLSMWEATFAEVVQEVKALRGEQYRFRDGWLFSRFPAAWEAVDAATHSLADGMLGLREHVLFKVQQTNPALIPGIADIDQPTSRSMRSSSCMGRRLSARPTRSARSSRTSRATSGSCKLRSTQPMASAPRSSRNSTKHLLRRHRRRPRRRHRSPNSCLRRSPPRRHPTTRCRNGCCWSVALWPQCC